LFIFPSSHISRRSLDASMAYSDAMLRKDYIERLTRRLAEAVAKMLGLLEAGLGEEAEAMLDAMYAEHLGLPKGLIESLDEASKRQVLAGRAEVAVRLLRAEAELRLAQGRTLDAQRALGLAKVLEDDVT
jgi:hypothetical protein